MVLVGDVDAVDLDDAVALEQAGQLGGRRGVHLADVLAGLGLLGVQVEAVALEVRPFGDDAEAGGGGVVRDV